MILFSFLLLFFACNFSDLSAMCRLFNAKKCSPQQHAPSRQWRYGKEDVDAIPQCKDDKLCKQIHEEIEQFQIAFYATYSFPTANVCDTQKTGKLLEQDFFKEIVKEEHLKTTLPSDRETRAEDLLFPNGIGGCGGYATAKRAADTAIECYLRGSMEGNIPASVSFQKFLQERANQHANGRNPGYWPCYMPDLKKEKK